MRNLMLWGLFLGVTACASVTPIPVAPGKLEGYWLAERSPALPMVTFHGPVTACVVVEFTISPAGKPRQLSAVTASQTDGPFVAAALSHIRALRYKPATENSGRTPVIIRQTVKWVWDGWANDKAINEAVLAKCAH